MILGAFHLAGKTKNSVLYEIKNKRPPVQKRSLLNRVSSCSTGGCGSIRDAAFASASPATPSRRPDRVLFEILRQALSCNEFPALQYVFSDFSTGLQPAFDFHYPAQHEPGPKEWDFTTFPPFSHYREKSFPKTRVFPTQGKGSKQARSILPHMFSGPPSVHPSVHHQSDVA